MTSTITLSSDERNTLLDYLRRHPQPQLRLRAHIILLLADGHPWDLVRTVLFCSTRTIARWKQRFQHGRVPALLGQPRGVPLRFATYRASVVLAWVTQQTPRVFGFVRSRWCCQTIVLRLWRTHPVEVSRETVRRWLRQADLVWRRPRPVLKRRDPQHEAKMDALRQLLLHWPDDETVVFQDEVDVNLNPKIGSMWMRRGQQTEVATPGDNDKCYLAGSLHGRTGKLFHSSGPKRDAKLFVRHVHDLRRHLRCYKKIHVICDNARFHWNCWAVWEFVARYRDRVERHFLPKYAPQCNPIERVWWHLHEEITRNHQGGTLEELVELVLAWLEDRKTFTVEDSVYHTTKAA